MRYGWAVGRISGWTGATAASAVLAWAALQPVLDAAVPERFTPLTDTELRAEAAAVAPPTAAGTLAATPPEPEAELTPGDEREPSPGADDDASGTGEPTAPDDPDDSGGGSGESGGTDGGPAPGEPASSEPEVTDDGWTVVESEDGTSYVRTFETGGGVATIEVEPGQATLISATPVEPYAVEVHHDDPERLVVQFYVTDHMWVVDAMWWENRPYGTVTEVP